MIRSRYIPLHYIKRYKQIRSHILKQYNHTYIHTYIHTCMHAARSLSAGMAVKIRGWTVAASTANSSR